MSNMVALHFPNIDLVAILIRAEAGSRVVKKVGGGGPDTRLS